MLDVDTICNLLIFLIFLFFLIIFIIVFRAFITNDFPTYSITDFDESSVNTGDIVIVGYTHIFGKLVRGFTCSVWTHSGVIWRDPITNFPYVVELGIYKKKFKGLFKIPLELWRLVNKKQIKGILKYNSTLELDTEAFENIFKRFKNIKIDKFNYKWYKFLYKKKYYNDNNRTIFTCFEFTIMLLQELGIYSKKYHSSSYFPGDIGNNNIKTNKGHYYSNVVLIL